MISGGTTAQIFSRETGKEIIANLDYVTADVPVTARINGINLVTEGVVTMSKCIDLINQFKNDYKKLT